MIIEKVISKNSSAIKPDMLFSPQPCVSPRRLSLMLVSSAWALGALYALLPATELWGRYKVMENGMRSDESHVN